MVRNIWGLKEASYLRTEDHIIMTKETNVHKSLIMLYAYIYILISLDHNFQRNKSVYVD